MHAAFWPIHTTILIDIHQLFCLTNALHTSIVIIIYVVLASSSIFIIVNTHVCFTAYTVPVLIRFTRNILCKCACISQLYVYILCNQARKIKRVVLFILSIYFVNYYFKYFTLTRSSRFEFAHIGIIIALL